MTKENTKEKPNYEEFHIENSVYLTEVPASYRNRKPFKSININEIEALIPGTILEINIEEGQQVEEGERLLILEAMKMRNLIVSPKAGTIKSILVQPGEIVSKGKLLILMD
jgi:biotin carboxyl carrier protein